MALEQPPSPHAPSRAASRPESGQPWRGTRPRRSGKPVTRRLPDRAALRRERRRGPARSSRTFSCARRSLSSQWRLSAAPPLIGGDGVFQRRAALLQPLDDLLEFRHGVLEAHRRNFGRFSCHRPTSAPRLQTPFILLCPRFRFKLAGTGMARQSGRGVCCREHDLAGDLAGEEAAAARSAARSRGQVSAMRGLSAPAS